MKRQIRVTVRRVFTCAIALLFVGCVGLSAEPVQAACVVPMNMKQLADGAGQVIVGRVTSIHSYWTTSPRTIESQVSFDQVEYLKGPPGVLAVNTFVLRIPGGSVDGTTMRLCCAPILSVGQTWLLFLQPTYKTHPVVGLSQGAFQLVEQTNGTKQVQAVSGAAVLGLDDAGYVRIARRGALAMDRLRSAHRVRIVNIKPTLATLPIDWLSFRALIEPILVTSTNHHLIAPAGQPNPDVIMATALQRSAAGSSSASTMAKSGVLAIPPLAKASSARASQTVRRISTERSVVPIRDTGRPARSEAPR